MATRDVFSDEELQRLREFPEINRAELIRYFTLAASDETIQPDLIIPTAKRTGQHPSLTSIYQALAEHEKTLTYPDAVEQDHTEYAELRPTDSPRHPHRPS